MILKLHGALLIMRISAFTSVWDRLVAFVHQRKSYAGKDFILYFATQDSPGDVSLVCPVLVDGLRFGRYKSKHIGRYADGEFVHQRCPGLGRIATIACRSS